MTFERGAERFTSIVRSKLEVVVLGKFAYLLEHVNGDGGIGPSGRDNRFEADLGVFVVGQTQEVSVRAGKVFAPITEKMRGGGAGVIVWVGGGFSEEIGVDPSTLLMEPKRFDEVMSVVWIGGVKVA